MPRMVEVALRAAAAGDYAAADVVSQNVTDTLGILQEIKGAATVNGGVAILDSIAQACDEDAVLWRLRYHFFNRQMLPAEVEMDDNIAADWAKVAPAGLGYLGYVTMEASVDRGTLLSWAQADNLRKLLKCAPHTQSLFYAIETLDAEANETAGMTIRSQFYFWE